MNDIRKKIIIIFCAIIGLIVAMILVMKFYNQPKTGIESNGDGQKVGEITTGAVTGNNQSAIQGQTSVPAVKAKPKSTLPSTEVYVKQLTEVFTERFFSYSNQNDNSHIEDAVALSTDVMAKWIKTQAQEMASVYQGVTTQVIASSVRSLTSEKAVVGVDVQQTFDGLKSGAISRTGRAELVKVGNDWKIDGFYWE